MTSGRFPLGSDEFVEELRRCAALMRGDNAILLRPEDFALLGYALRELLALPKADQKVPAWTLPAAEKMLEGLAKITQVDYAPRQNAPAGS